MLRITLAVGALAASVSIAGAQVVVTKTFAGQSGPNPPENEAFSTDMMGGVSPRYLVGFLNAGISVRSKSDGKELQPSQTLREFWTAALKNAGAELVGQPYDPRIFFDPLTSRWFATSDSRADAKIMGSMT
ncbi:MAG: hypothetical protein IMZ67_03835, partial [Acidobacteria bacterium]|nr:hypothetical protein [Acidobacteriota bacterium]